ncbi:tagaturonate reductase [Halobacillus aidingensis]|uniref:Tagaturonate reductase n=1 Tax=Halobacillus aidingensis TaxID=240303 RepID=A0A1H0IPS3_HALAD|nr:tagaturonate reductase [Halobacillus aidingensis]SDO33051.1 tagaturonate reductase [Halobacillus aidingensis]
MERLNRETAAHLPTIDVSNKSMIDKELPIRAIQFGEGNFLRAYLNWMLERMNRKQLFNGRTVAIQPTPHGRVVPKLEKQDHLYTTILQGMEDGEEVQHVEVNSTIARSINPYDDWGSLLALAEQDSIEFIFSNTTEAGLAYMQEAFPENESPLSFPGKLAALMYRRFIHTKGDPQSGFTIIPCELVEENGKLLKAIVVRVAKEWSLPASFLKWVDDHNVFCDTLVDRIVPGYPGESAEEWQKKLGYEDVLMAVGEPFHLFVIESELPLEHKLPFQKAGLQVKWAEVKPYRDLKVGLLNAPHTLLFSVGFMVGLRTVKEVMADDVVSTYVRQVLYKDLLPRLSFDDTEKSQFADSVIERFQNPFVKHKLSALGQNAVQKLKSRVFPLISEDEKLPESIALSLASLLHYYKPHTIHEGHFMGVHNGEEYKVRDDQVVLEAFIDFWSKDQQGKEEVRSLLRDERLWGRNLALHTDMIFNYFDDINQHGAKTTTESLFEGTAAKTQN